MDCGGSRPSVLIVQRRPTIGHHDQDPFSACRDLSDGQLSRRRGEAETPTSNQSPRGVQGRRLLGPAALRTCPFASLLSQVQARLGPGGYYRHSGNGGTHTCLPAACGVAPSTT